MANYIEMSGGERTMLRQVIDSAGLAAGNDPAAVAVAKQVKHLLDFPLSASALGAVRELVEALVARLIGADVHERWDRIARDCRKWVDALEKMPVGNPDDEVFELTNGNPP